MLSHVRRCFIAVSTGGKWKSRVLLSALCSISCCSSQSQPQIHPAITHFTLQTCLIPLEIPQGQGWGKQSHSDTLLIAGTVTPVSSCYLLLLLRVRDVFLFVLGFYLGYTSQFNAQEMMHSLFIHGDCRVPILEPQTHSPAQNEGSSLLSLGSALSKQVIPKILLYLTIILKKLRYN